MKYIKNATTGEVKHVSNEEASAKVVAGSPWRYISKFAGREKLGRPEDNG